MKESLDSTAGSGGLENPPGKEIFLEIGPYTRPVPLVGEREFGANEPYIGADIDLKEALASKSALKPRNKSEVLVADARHLPFKDKSVARMFFGNVFGSPQGLTAAQRKKLEAEGVLGLIEKNEPKTIAEQNLILREAKRALKEGGTIVITENNTPVPVDIIRALLDRNGFVVEREILLGDESYSREIKLYRPERTIMTMDEETPYIIYARPASQV